MEEVKVFIEGGFILLAKNIIEDEIWEKPPMYLKVWIWILSRAEYRTDNKRMQRGEVVLDVNTLREECSHYSGFRKVTPSYKEIYGILQWLQYGDDKYAYGGNYGEEHGSSTEGNMVVKTGVKREKRYKVLNYNVYQASENYGGKHGGQRGSKTEVNAEVKRRENLLLDKELKELKEYKEGRREESSPVLNSGDTLNNDTENNSSDHRQFSKDYSEVIQFMESSGFGVISANVYEDLEYWFKTFDKDMLKKAAQLSDENGVPKYSYMKGILRTWKNRKYTSLQDVEASEKQFNAQRNNQTDGTRQETESEREQKKQQEIQGAHLERIMGDIDMDNLPF